MRFPPHVPTASANELGFFACQTQLAKRRQVISRRKTPRGNIVNRYRYVLNAICACLRSEGFLEGIVDEAYEKFKNIEHAGTFWPSVRERNITLMRRFRSIAHKASPPNGEHLRKTKGQYFEFEGVQISVLPDIVTLCPNEGIFTYTKFRLAAEKYTWDASEYVLLLLEKFARTQERELGLKFDMSQCKLIDCADQIVFEGHRVSSRKEAMLRKAVADYRSIWPTVPKVGE